MPDQFDVGGDWVIVYGVQVLKKGKVDHRERIRIIPIPMDEPLVRYMIDWVESCESEILFPRSRSWAYKQIRKVDPNWWPHRFRSERACQLVVEYGYRVSDLMKWFNWSDKVPTTYVQLDVDDPSDPLTRISSYADQVGFS